jgi:hypothetical protein
MIPRPIYGTEAQIHAHGRCAIDGAGKFAVHCGTPGAGSQGSRIPRNRPAPPGLRTHEFTSLAGANGEKIFEAYAQNDTPGACRIFWHYGPDEIKGRKRTPVITVVAITRHP